MAWIHWGSTYRWYGSEEPRMFRYEASFVGTILDFVFAKLCNHFCHKMDYWKQSLDSQNKQSVTIVTKSCFIDKNWYYDTRTPLNLWHLTFLEELSLCFWGKTVNQFIFGYKLKPLEYVSVYKEPLQVTRRRCKRQCLWLKLAISKPTSRKSSYQECGRLWEQIWTLASQWRQSSAKVKSRKAVSAMETTVLSVKIDQAPFYDCIILNYSIL